jgi:hypothetical protein
MFGDLTIVPNPSCAEALLKIPEGFPGNKLILRILSISGNIIYKKSLKSSSKLEKLFAQDYSDGIYIIELSDEFGASARCKWIVNHL